MKIGICQINTTVGDFEGNRRRIEAAAHQARGMGARLAIVPELALCGYPPEELLLRDAFLAAHDQALRELTSNVPPDLAVLVGCLARNEEEEAGGRPLHNAVALIEDGIARVVARKCLLPTYDVFDESRYFEPWTRPQDNVVEIGGTRVGIVVCEDAWNDPSFFGKRRYSLDPVAKVVEAGAQVVVNLSASPWAAGKEKLRQSMVRAAAAHHDLPFVYVNLVGGNVALQFDGGSLALQAGGVAFAPVYFKEHVQVVDTALPWTIEPAAVEPCEMQYLAIVQGVRDYCRKFGFTKALLGLSGGIDSSVVATLAADALGPENVTGIALPSEVSSSHSVEDAERLARNLGIELLQIPIEPVLQALRSGLERSWGAAPEGVTEENLHARARGLILMAESNRTGKLLLATGNKSETAVGYATLYGDMCGGLAAIADLWKSEVWRLARWLNRERERIPLRSIEKPPSPELRPGQLTTDTLPPYAELDPVLRYLVEEDLSVAETAERTGMPRAKVAEMFARVQAAEFKRFQYAPTIRLTDRCWVGRRVPVMHRYREA
jgi:NAD+ synthetase